MLTTSTDMFRAERLASPDYMRRVAAGCQVRRIAGAGAQFLPGWNGRDVRHRAPSGVSCRNRALAARRIVRPELLGSDGGGAGGIAPRRCITAAPARRWS